MDAYSRKVTAGFFGVVGVVMTLLAVFDVTHPNRTMLVVVGPLLSFACLRFLHAGEETRYWVDENLVLIRRVTTACGAGLIAFNVFPTHMLNLDGSGAYEWLHGQRLMLGLGVVLIVASLMAKPEGSAF